MKKLLTILFSFIFTASLFAMPGFSSFIQDQAGEFVYYRDHSFERESYIGFLEYDSNTYQLRYFAPQTKNLPEKTVATLVTLDLIKNHIDFTGEKIILADYNNPEDVDIINYLHDLIYEFSKRRNQFLEINPANDEYVNFDTMKTNGLYQNDYYAQFGGDITIVYDVIIPFFNIKRIENTKGEALFECVELGKIKNAEETIFDNYKPFPPKIKIKQNSKKVKGVKPVDFEINNQKVVVDSSWEEKLDYMWVQGEDAILTLMTYNTNNNNDPYYIQYFLIRSFLECKDNNFIDYTTCDVIFTDKGFKLYSDTYAPNTKKVYYTVKYITLNKEKNYDYLSFAATRGAYQIKQTYYDKILKSYTNY